MSNKAEILAGITDHSRSIWEDAMLQIYSDLLSGMMSKARTGQNCVRMKPNPDASVNGKWMERPAMMRAMRALLTAEGFRVRIVGEYLDVWWPSAPERMD